MAGGKPKKQSNVLGTITIGYVAIPAEVDRDAYIKSCFRRNRVSVYIEGGCFINDIYITNEALQNISFPDEIQDKGTQVVINTIGWNGTPIVIGTLPTNDESPTWEEDIFRFRKVIGGVSMWIEVNPRQKRMNLSVNSEEETELVIESTGSESSKVKIVSSGEVEVKTDKKTIIKGYDTIEQEIVNAEVEAKEEGKEKRTIIFDKDKIEIRRKIDDKIDTITLDNDKFLIDWNNQMITSKWDNEGLLMQHEDGSIIRITSAGITIVKGGSGLKKTLDDLLAALIAHTHTTGVGPSGPPINVTDFQTIKQDIPNYMEE